MGRLYVGISVSLGSIVVCDTLATATVMTYMLVHIRHGTGLKNQ